MRSSLLALILAVEGAHGFNFQRRVNQITRQLQAAEGSKVPLFLTTSHIEKPCKL